MSGMARWWVNRCRKDAIQCRAQNRVADVGPAAANFSQSSLVTACCVSALDSEKIGWGRHVGSLDGGGAGFDRMLTRGLADAAKTFTGSEG